MGASPAKRADNPAELPPEERLRSVENADVVAPYDEPILQQILETVQRIAAAALRATPTRDVLLSAEDIAQDTMATLHQRGQPAPTVNLLAWTIGIAKLKLKEATRHSRAQVPQVPLHDSDPVAPQETDDQVLGVMHYVWLLDHIAPVDRMIVEWRQAGYTSREIAQELQRIGYSHMTANNVDQRFCRALKTLRAHLFPPDIP
jgi:DNA-directed RNA polymerase specialized sigma24 family protein